MTALPAQPSFAARIARRGLMALAVGAGLSTLVAGCDLSQILPPVGDSVGDVVDDAGPTCDPVACQALVSNPCELGTCNTATDSCMFTPKAEGAYCTEGDICIIASSCKEGVCVGGDIADEECGQRVCGIDECGYPCGTCAAGATCTNDGECEADCTPDCTGFVCGDDGCGGSCGTCADPLYCASNQEACIAQCEPQCTGKKCGSDGCGETCGECLGAQDCDAAGQCIDDLVKCSEGILAPGCCYGTSLKYCDGEKIVEQGCDECGWDADKGFYACGFDGGEDPSGVYLLACPAP